MRKFLVLSFLALAACGADGEPLPPEDPATSGGPGVSVNVSGTAEFGISG